jgi:hypothetical protein
VKLVSGANRDLPTINLCIPSFLDTTRHETLPDPISAARVLPTNTLYRNWLTDDAPQHPRQRTGHWFADRSTSETSADETLTSRIVHDGRCNHGCAPGPTAATLYARLWLQTRSLRAS